MSIKNNTNLPTSDSIVTQELNSMNRELSEKQIHVSIVVPAYNEQKRIPDTLEKISRFCRTKPYNTEIIVVDDGSIDSTTQIVEELISSCDYKDLRLIRNEHKGKAVAVRTGMLDANGDVVLFTDADLATPIEAIDDILPYFEQGYDIVIGSREGMNARRIGEPVYRHIMGRVFNWIVQSVALSGIKDTQCGFKAFRNEAAQNVFKRMKLYGPNTKIIKNSAVTAFDVEILFIGKKLGYKIKAVPVQWTYGVGTKVNPIRDTLRNFSDVLRVRLNIWRGFYDK